MDAMIKRSARSKSPPGNSRITPEQARAAAYHVYRDRLTGSYVMSKARAYRQNKSVRLPRREEGSFGHNAI